MTKKLLSKYCLLLLCTYFFSFHSLYAADKKNELSKGQLVYVPAYSHIYSGNKEEPFLLTVTLSIRNIDPYNQINITLVDYYATQGKLLKQHIDKPKLLNPLESLRYVIPQRDESGGSGANFLVKWHSDEFVNPPIIESIMIGAQAQQGISFSSRGREILSTEK